MFSSLSLGKDKNDLSKNIRIEILLLHNVPGNFVEKFCTKSHQENTKRNPDEHNECKYKYNKYQSISQQQKVTY